MPLLSEVTHPPAALAAAVSRAYGAVRRQQEPESLMHDRFRAGRSRLLLIRALQLAGPPEDVLAVGCGTGYAGCGPGYVRDVIESVWPGAHVDAIALEPETGSLATRSYDLVATHSLLHFMLSPGTFCNMLTGAVRPGGAFLMAHEPNRRFWTNPHCREASAAWHRGEALRRRLDPRWLGRAILRRLKHATPTPPIEALVNSELHRHYRLQPPLTAAQVRHMVDPWMPVAGRGGFDLDEIRADWLRGFALRWSGTTDWLGDADAVLRGTWARLDADLMRRYPADGACLTALWLRNQS